MLQRFTKCEMCGRKLEQPARGRPRLVHPECKVLHDTLKRLENALEPEALDALGMTTEATVELRYRLFTLVSDQVPRARFPKGHPKAGQFVPRAHS